LKIKASNSYRIEENNIGIIKEGTREYEPIKEQELEEGPTTTFSAVSQKRFLQKPNGSKRDIAVVVPPGKQTHLEHGKSNSPNTCSKYNSPERRSKKEELSNNSSVQ